VIVLSAATAPATGRALSRLFAELWNSAELLIWRNVAEHAANP